MNVAFGDIFNQGRLSVYVTNISEEGVLIQGNNLWVPKEGATGNSLEYENLASSLGVELGGWSFGAQFGDLNNDGTQDLFLTNGYVSAAKGTSYWYEFSMVAGGHSSIISDAANWPQMEGRSLSGYQQKRVWLNDGAGHFKEVAQAVGYTDTHDGRGVALVDLWNRGVLDVLVANQRGPLLIYKTSVPPENAWVDFELTGSRSNRSAIGAQVRLYWNGHEQLQEVSGGCGYAAQNQRRLHFGLGKAPRIEKAVIRWPSGTVQTIESPAAGVVAPDRGAPMTTTTSNQAPLPAESTGAARFLTLDNRFLAPVLITLILLVGQLSFGILESYDRTVLAIASSIVMELLLGRLVTGKWPHLASAYITGISVGILIRSPAFWPYVLCSLVSITSKYAIRWRGRHLWNPSNLGRQRHAVPGSRLGGQPERPVGQRRLAHAGDLALGLAHHLAAAPVPHLPDLRPLILRSFGRAQRPHRRTVSGGGGTDHRADVPALRLFHDHRSQDDGAVAGGASARSHSWWRLPKQSCG